MGGFLVLLIALEVFPVVLVELKKLAGKLRLTIDNLAPNREIIFRSDGQVKYLKFSKLTQLYLCFIVVLVAGWAIFASFMYFIHHEIVVSKDKQIIGARMAYRSLLAEIHDYQDKFSSLTTELGKNHSLMLNLVEKNAALQQDFKSAKNKLATSKSRTQRILSARTRLKQKLSGIESELEELNNHNFSLKGNLSSVTTNLEKALSERNKAQEMSKQLTAKVLELENNLNKIYNSEKDILLRLTQRTEDDIQNIQNIIKRTGIKLARFMKPGIKPNVRGLTGQGGPFIALSPNKSGKQMRSLVVNLNNKLTTYGKLRAFVQSMPIYPPLDYFSISSHYGKRRDPINKRWAVHAGIDLVGPKKMAVYATAPGVVTYSGRKGKYGRFIEIDHGHGIKTRYGPIIWRRRGRD